MHCPHIQLLFLMDALKDERHIMGFWFMISTNLQKTLMMQLQVFFVLIICADHR